ncbi:MAG: IS1595 family transposase [Chloroflexota bacterium]|nr:IS1595 family transposase [Chloroflexota bacterium]
MNSEPKHKGHTPLLTDLLRDEADARAYLAEKRWPNGLVCAFQDCGGSEVTAFEVKASIRKNGKHVPSRSLYKCKACGRQFSVTKGTIFEDSKIPLRTWLIVAQRMCVSKKSVSARQIEREFGVTYESAWFMCHRIRYAMTDKNPSLLSGTIEADETYVGGKARGHKKDRMGFPGAVSKGVQAARDRKTPVFGMKERGGKVRAHVIPDVDAYSVLTSIEDSVDMKRTFLMSDEARAYRWIQSKLPYDVIRHKSEYVRGETHTQSIESFWAILKRGLVGTYHHVDAGYLNQYVQEYAFRHNTRHISDGERFNALLGQISGRVDWYLGQQASEREPS